MGFLKKNYSYVFIIGALLLFFYPLLFGKTLTAFSDTYAIAPWSAHPPVGWFHSNAIDASPIYFFNPSDILNRELLREGQAFTWNPYVGFGAPWLGVMQGAPYFPGKLISILLPDYWKGQDLMLVVMLLTAGFGNYLLLRSMGATREAATFSALAFMFCQRLFLVINMPSFTIECLLPIMLYSINEAVKRKSIGFALFAGVIGGSQFLGGFPEASFMFGLVSGLFFLWLMLQDYNSVSVTKRNLLLGLAIAVVTILLSAFQLVEFGKLLAASNTAHSTGYGLVVKEPFWLLAMLLPNFFGTPFESFWTSAISPYDHMPSSMFCGISTILLAIVGLLWRDAPNRKFIWFFAALFFVFAGYDYGFPVLKFVGYLPFINMMSTAWNVFVIPFALSVLAGFGVQSIRQRGATVRLSIAFIGYSLMIMGLLLLGSGSTLAPPLLSFLPLFYVAPIFIVAVIVFRQLHGRVIGAGLLFSLITLEAYLCAQDFGYLHYYGPAPQPPSSLTWLTRNVGHERIFGVDGIFPANMLIQNRIRDIRHLDAMYPELYVGYVDAIWKGARSNVYQIGNPEWKDIADPLLDLAAVKFVVAPRPLTKVPEGYSEVYSDPAATIYRNNGAFARARYVPNILKHVGQLTAESMKTRIQDLRTGVFLDEYFKTGRVEGACPASALPPVEFLEDDVSQIRLRVDAPCDGLVVLADLFFQGWKATINGQEAPIYKANVSFRAVEVRAGKNEILMSYSPAAWRFGMPIALVTLSGILIVGVRCFARRRRTVERPLAVVA
jgi:hypothetical protein